MFRVCLPFLSLALDQLLMSLGWTALFAAHRLPTRRRLIRMMESFALWNRANHRPLGAFEPT